MRHITALIILFTLAGTATLPVTPVAEGEEAAVLWLHGSNGFDAASEMAGDGKKFLLLDFFHPH